MAVERAHYSVVASSPPYEIRDYPSSTVAIVTVDGSRGAAVNAGFRLLANYIFGNNQQKSKIAMTAPVTQLPQSSSTAGNWVVRFMMPSGYDLQSLPAPTDPHVRLERLRAHQVAAVRFSGFWTDASLESHKQQLLQWMETQHLLPGADPIYAYYDPPWTPWFMRTTEVLIDISRTVPLPASSHE